MQQDAVDPDPIRPRLTLGLLSVQHALIHGQAALYPIVFLALIDEFGVTAGTIAILVAISSILTGSLQLAFGVLTRWLSRRTLLAAGGILLGAMTTAQALASSFLQFAVVNLVSRLGGAPQHPVGNALLAEQYPEQRRGFAISAHIAGGNVGTVIVGVVATAAVSTLGWRTAVALLGVPAIVVAIAIALLVRESGEDRAHARAAGSVRSLYGQVLADRNLRWLFVSSVVGGGARGLGVLNVFVPLYLSQVVGLDLPTIGAMYAVLLAASVPGPLVAGWLSDRYGRKPLIVGVYLAGAASLALFVAAGSSVPVLWVAIVLLSAFSFVESPQLQALLADITPPGLRDAAYSTYFALAFGVGSMWGLVYGGLTEGLGATLGLPIVFVVMAAASVLAAATVLPIRLREEARRRA
ncbi:MAG TPA: MFS transporter [Candidatus Limnocylindrales bacterium]|nr:MFS transporter [Candidatus Limnocylindrales bacterium]